MGFSRVRGARWGLIIALGCAGFAAGQPADGASAEQDGPTSPVTAEPTPDAGTENEAPPTAPSLPKAADVADLSLEEILATPITAGDTGSFGARLEPMQARDSNGVFVHGFVIAELLKRDTAPLSFGLEFFDLIVGARLADRVFPEAQLEARENGTHLELKYGQIDVVVVPGLLTVRVGKMLAPIGAFNEYLYPEYLNKMVFPPRSHLDVLPRGFTVVGAELRGAVELSADHASNVNYAVFVANSPFDAENPVGAEAGEAASFVSAENSLDLLNRKSVGGRLGVHLLNRLDVGVSGFAGVYSTQANRDLFMFDADAAYLFEGLSVRSEFIWAQKRTDDGAESRWGFYAQAAYRFWGDRLEPAVQYDQVGGFDDAARNRKTLTAGLNLHPFAKGRVKLVVKVHGEVSFSDVTSVGFLSQVGLGF